MRSSKLVRKPPDHTPTYCRSWRWDIVLASLFLCIGKLAPSIERITHGCKVI